MASIKKQLIRLPPVGSGINASDSDWLSDLSQETCNHSAFDKFRFKEYEDGWQYARCICKVCAHQWDAWSAPGTQTMSLRSLLALINGAPLPEGEGDNG